LKKVKSLQQKAEEAIRDIPSGDKPKRIKLESAPASAVGSHIMRRTFWHLISRAADRSITLILLVAVLGIVIVFFQNMRLKVKGLVADVEVLRAQVLEAEQYQRAPLLTGLKSAHLGNCCIKFKEYPIPASAVMMEDYWQSASYPAPSWDPQNGKLPDPYPARYAYEGPPFHPWTFLQNVTQICNYADLHKAHAKVQALIDDLVDDLNTHLVEADGALFVRYSFKHQIYDCELKSGWVSAFGNAAALCALVKLYATTKSERYRDMARKLAASFLQVRTGPAGPGPWVSFADEANYLWFEECPLPAAEQIHIFNGHVFAIMALDYYLSIAQEDREEILLLVRAGITTMHRYLAEYRRPGRANRYSLYPPYRHHPLNADYSPQRAIVCIEWLHEASAEPYFARMADAFRTDCPLAP
jgi:hypothetical protein